MRAFITSVLLFAVIASQVVAADDRVRRGKAIYNSIGRTYPGLTLYLESGLTGENARLIADVPTSKWKAMSRSDKHALAAFVQSELATVRSDPSRYSLTPKSAPIWPTHRAAFQQICDTCWEIHIGRYVRSEHALNGDDWEVAMKGNAPRESGSRPILHEGNLQPLSSSSAVVGARLYNSAGGHEATIVAVDLPNDLIRVRYVRNGATEPKHLSAVGQFWFTRK